ncbi:polyubiquitin-B-like [Triticum dicoccoides]|uniref:polyubiquitin-B-like n=1 Tax=Triticum dicoccoides TaxID=85692 RepID=UPI00188E4F40|nr:polyubiquitin-B-like [Triticum dicoccoides]
MEVTLETTQGRRFTVEIWYLSTVRRIKEYILRQEGIPVESQRLFFQGQELQDDRDTQHYPIVEGSHVSVFLEKAEMEDDKELAQFDPPVDGMEMEVRVVARQPPPPPACNDGNGAAKVNNKLQQRMSVEVKWGARAVTLEVSDMDAVKELRAELGSGAPHLLLPDDGAYFFIYKQNVMEEERTLRWHDVKAGDTIEIFNGRVTGGA